MPPLIHSPLAKNQAAAGTQTSAAPTAGSMERNVINTPQSKAASTPKDQKVKPPIVP
ncbi:hypothetical protein D3C80_2114530 [compost metagenome]